MKPMTVREFFKQFPDDESCLNHIFNVRFGQSYECPKCKKPTKWHRIKAERAYSCQRCGHHLHPTVGTLFEKSRTPLQLWFYAIYLFITTRHGVSGKELQRQLGVTYKCAWRMGHQIREHMAEIDGDDPLSGHVEVDETFIGGKRPGNYNSRGKTVLLGMVERDGRVITEVVESHGKKTVLPHVEESIEKGSTVSSDEAHAYKGLSKLGYEHGSVEHSRDQWVDGIHHTNTIEGYWKHFKDSIDSTHIHVSKKHLEKYSKEFEYRYNSRKRPARMFPELISSYPQGGE